jgi:hypothetical protein
MTPPEDSRSTPAVSGPLGLGLAVCAGILVAVLGLVASQEAADAYPVQTGFRGRPQHTFKTREPGREVRPADWLSAAERAVRLPDDPLRQAELQEAVIAWVNHEPQAAIAWVRDLPDESERSELLLVGSGEMVRTDPVSALRLAVELPASAGVDEIIRRAATEWAAEDPAAAMAWAETISDEPLRQAVLAAELVAWSETAPPNAATRALEKLPAGRLLDNTLVSIVQRWAQTDAEAAAAWVERFPDGQLRAAAVENLLSQWRQTDPVAARDWQPGS